jgi:hypothetical protein
MVNVKIHSPAISNDPAGWDIASYTADPVDEIEPLDAVSSEYRQCALRMLAVFNAVDEFMCTTHTGKPSKKWHCVSLALGLFSTRGKTETEVAEEWGISRASISKDVVTVLRLAHLENNPAFGLKSVENRRLYMRTNGRRPETEAVNAQADLIGVSA